MMAVKKKTAVNEERKEELFTLEQLIAAEKFGNRKDMLKAILSDREEYTISEVEKRIEKFMKGKVK
ncbi:hypothetical protein IMSAGC005_01121 [Lachnospiraceae bacterium]|jgi:hypothetical protein|nr:hypothetical protein IMSAGC005_01121 [Lachnospiraceae bacterium]